MRDMERLTILFKDEETIWAFPKGSRTNVVFHRWWESRWNYSTWSAFRESLMLKRDLDIWDCFTLADRFNITRMGTARAPTITGMMKLKFERRKPWERQTKKEVK